MLYCRGHLYHIDSSLDCQSTGRAIDPASVAWFVTNIISLAQIIPGPVKLYSAELWPKTPLISFYCYIVHSGLGLDISVTQESTGSLSQEEDAKWQQATKTEPPERSVPCSKNADKIWNSVDWNFSFLQAHWHCRVFCLWVVLSQLSLLKDLI